MSNGAAALALVETLSPTTEPAAQDALPEIEAAIGDAVADATALMAAAVVVDHGFLTSDRRERGGDLFVKLYELQSTYPGTNFDAAARRAGLKVLRQRLKLPGDATIDAALAELINYPLEVLAGVMRLEAVWAN